MHAEEATVSVRDRSALCVSDPGPSTEADSLGKGGHCVDLLQIYKVFFDDFQTKFLCFPNWSLLLPATVES